MDFWIAVLWLRNWKPESRSRCNFGGIRARFQVWAILRFLLWDFPYAICSMFIFSIDDRRGCAMLAIRFQFLLVTMDREIILSLIWHELQVRYVSQAGHNFDMELSVWIWYLASYMLMLSYSRINFVYLDFFNAYLVRSSVDFIPRFWCHFSRVHGASGSKGISVLRMTDKYSILNL